MPIAGRENSTVRAPVASATWVSLGRIAEFKEVSLSIVRDAVARGDLGDSVSANGLQIDPYHKDAEEWFGGKYRAGEKKGRRKKSAQEQADEADNPLVEGPRIDSVADDPQIQKITDAVILLTELGTPSQIQAWARVRKEIAMAATAESKRDQAKGQLIPRSLIQRAVFGYLDALNRRLLEDISPTIATRIGKGTPEQRRIIEDLIGVLIKRAQKDVDRLLGTVSDDDE